MGATTIGDPALGCAGQLTITALTALPRIEPGVELAPLLCTALGAQGLQAHDHDVVVVASKLVAKAEGRYVDLASVEPSPRARELAAIVEKDARLIEVILWDSARVSRARKGVLITRHRSGHVSANAGLDQSNARPADAPAGSGPWVLRLPADADASAEKLRLQLSASLGVRLAVLVSDSLGRPFRFGTVGAAIGAAGFPVLFDQRGRRDLDGRVLEATITAPADQLAAACDLVLGQADEARGAAWVRGLRLGTTSQPASTLCRHPDEDLYL
jgi:coenzyme F420-0:L-glutamate ligase / coenzyme F420-1:gamma-L-glutamate ligase